MQQCPSVTSDQTVKANVFIIRLVIVITRELKCRIVQSPYQRFVKMTVHNMLLSVIFNLTYLVIYWQNMLKYKLKKIEAGKKKL